MRSLRGLIPALLIAGSGFASEKLGVGISGDVMRLRKDRRRGVTSVAGLSQELCSRQLPELRVLFGEVHIRVHGPLAKPEEVRVPPSFGQITVPGCRRATVIRQNTTWVSNECVYNCGRNERGDLVTLGVYVSRLSPAVVVRTNVPALDLFAGTKRDELPACLAAGSPQGVERRGTPAGALPEDCRWLLLWRGRATKTLGNGDMPLLIVPHSPLGRIERPGSGGLRMCSSDGEITVALLPLMGVLRPSVEQTRTWVKEGLPDAVRQSCRWWASHTGAFPVDVTETFGYDAESDLTQVKYTFRYLKLGKGGASAAPLPPMLALAVQQGFGRGSSPLKLRVPGPLSDTRLATVFGPYMVVDNTKECRWTLQGLRRYVGSIRETGPAVAASKPFEERLEKEVKKVLETDFLAPWFYMDGCFKEDLIERQLYWANPGEHLYYLAEFMNLLSPDTRKALLEHAQEYPQPEELGHMEPHIGQRREFYHVEQSFLHHRLWYEAGWKKTVPLFNLYPRHQLTRAVGRELGKAGWSDCRRAAAESLKGRDWATLFWFDGQGDEMAGVVACNRNFAGLLGLIRLSREMGDHEAEQLAWGQLARSAALRHAMGRYRRYLYDIGRIRMPQDPEWQVLTYEPTHYGHLISYNCTKPEHDIDQVSVLNQFEVVTGTYHPMGNWRFSMRPYQIPFRFMVPELARFLADHLKPEAARYVRVVAEYQPDWYLTWAEATLGTEHNANHPCDAYQNFLARAWILDEPPERLRKYLDVPHLARGDYFYMHKLAEIARAYRGVRWVRARD